MCATITQVRAYMRVNENPIYIYFYVIRLLAIAKRIRHKHTCVVIIKSRVLLVNWFEFALRKNESSVRAEAPCTRALHSTFSNCMQFQIVMRETMRCSSCPWRLSCALRLRYGLNFYWYLIVKKSKCNARSPSGVHKFTLAVGLCSHQGQGVGRRYRDSLVYGCGLCTKSSALCPGR